MTAWKEYQKKVVTGQSIGEQLDQMGTEVICQNRKYRVALMECCILYCSQHGIAFRGQDEGNNALNPGNLKSLMMLISRHCQQVRDRLNTTAKVLHGFTKSSKWNRPLPCKWSSRIHQKEIHEANYFTVLADETKDTSKREWLSITFRYVHGFKIVERFSGYILASELAARALADYILQKISDFSLDLNYLVSQLWQCLCHQWL